MKGYKVFNPDWTCRDFKYEVGKIYEMEEKPKCCEIGFHFCKNLEDCFNYYGFSTNNKVAEVEAVGDISYAKNDSKCATNKILIIKELSWYEVLRLVNTGKGNTGRNNSGDSNSGDYNFGDFNSGCSNIGKCNSGYNNTGKCNSGDNNTGNCNSGSFNNGAYNSGNFNSGNRNSGDANFGDFNSGNWNSGSYNSGDFNSGNRNFGCFNTKTKQKIMMFNKDSDWTYIDWMNSFARHILNMMPTESKKRQDWYNSLCPFYKKTIKSLPNFDADIFFEITGIKV